MLSHDELERFRYEDRLKAQFDRNTYLGLYDQGKEEGVEETSKKYLVRNIRLYEQLLKLPQTPDEQLLAWDISELQAKAKSLEQMLGVELP